jgi:hypothetical protein
MDINPTRGSRESTLDEVQPLTPDQFYVLYQGVLAAESEREFYRDATLVLGTGRLGLRPETLSHLHEGWVDWTTGSVVVPVHEPCACEGCLSNLRSETAATEGDHLGVLCQDEFFRPPTEAGARSIPFWWSRRLTGVLVEFFDRFGYPEFETSPTERLRTIAGRVPGLDPAAISARTLRASAARTFADLGLDDGALGDVMGVENPSAVRRFVRQGRSWGETDPLVPGHAFRSSYRVVGNPAAFADEPFEPTAYGAQARELRDRRNAPSSSRVGNPRPSAPELSVDASMRADAAEYLAPDSELLSVGEESVESFVPAWVRRHDSRDDPETVTPEPVAGSGRDAGSDPRSSEDDAVPDPAVGDGGSATAGPTPTSGGPSTPPTPDVGAGDDGTTTPEGPEMVHASLREVVDAPVADFPARYASTLVTGGDPVTGHVVVEPDRVVFDVSDAPVQEGAQAFVVPHGSVTDFTFDYDQDTTDAFGDGVALAFSWDATRERIAVEFDGDDNEFAANLLTQVFDGRDGVVSYPVREGGRVNEDVRTRPATLSIDGGTVVAEGEETVAEVDLSDVSSVDQSSQVYDGDSVPSVEVEFAVDGATETARIGFQRDGRLRKLFSKLAKVHYRHQRRKMRSLSLSDGEKECLVALHSMGGSAGGMDVSGMIDVDDFDAMIEGLLSKGLLESADDGPRLTDLGRTVVTEKIDDINF